MSDGKWRETSHAKGGACAREHAWIDWSEQDDGSILIKVNGGPVLRIATGPSGALSVHENIWSESRESMAACLRLAALARDADKLFEAHNLMGDILRSFRSFAFPDSDDGLKKTITGRVAKQTGTPGE